jgi:hypothetical protein
MSPIKWQVIANVEDANCRYIQLEIAEDFAPLRSFFFEASESEYPRIIESALKGVGSGFNSAGVTFSGDLDEGDEPIASEMVEIYDPLNSIQIPKITFMQVLLDVAEATLAIRQECGNASDQWEEQMKKAITALRLKNNGESSV